MSKEVADRLMEAARPAFVGRMLQLDILHPAIKLEELPFLLAWAHGPRKLALE